MFLILCFIRSYVKWDMVHGCKTTFKTMHWHWSSTGSQYPIGLQRTVRISQPQYFCFSLTVNTLFIFISLFIINKSKPLNSKL